MANQKSVRYSVSISYFTNIAVQNVNKVRTCAHEWTSSLNIKEKEEIKRHELSIINISPNTRAIFH